MTKDEIRERLAEIIWDVDFKEMTTVWCGTARNAAYVKADWMMERGVTVQEWIPVSERLPWTDGAPDQNADFFLVSFTGELQEVECRGFMFTATYNGDGKWSLPFKPYEDVTDGVTHWMPLPELPKEVE